MGKNIKQDDNHPPHFHTGAPLRGGGGGKKVHRSHATKCLHVNRP